MKRLPFVVLCLVFIHTQTLRSQVNKERELNYNRITSGLTQPQFKSGRTDFAMADMNLDGHVDILTIGDHGSPGTDQNGIMIWLGDGQGNFNLQKEGNFGYGGIATGDVNNDGLPDVAYGMHHNYSGLPFGDQLIEVALGDGSGISWTPWDVGLASAGETYGMFGTDLADFNNDGLLDLVSVSFGCCNGVYVYLNQGDGSWVHSFAATGGNSDMLVETGDFNNDGFVDFVATVESGLAYFGDGNGSFTMNDEGLPIPQGWMLTGVSAADVNGDGADDIAFVNTDGGLDVYFWSTQESMWLPLSGNLPATGTFQFTQLADMNSDGITDLLAYGSRLLQVWLSDGSGNWELATSFQTPGQMGNGRALRSGSDLDHNGYPDIVLLTQEGTWITNKNNLYVYVEATEPEDLWIMSNYPAGGERFYSNSTRMIRWSSQVPNNQIATVSIYFSSAGPNGPWTSVSEQLPDNGLLQWIIPEVNSENCFLRYELIAGGQTTSYVINNPFTIMGPVGDKINPDIIDGPVSYIKPNPAQTFVQLNEYRAINRFRLIDLTGRTILDVYAPGQYIDVSKVINGTYSYQLEFGDRIVTGMLIKM
jgi:hypothetical protein